MPDDDKKKFTLPSKVTLPYCVITFDLASTIWANHLITNGMTKDEIETIKKELFEKYKNEIVSINRQCCNAVLWYYERMKNEPRRVDFFGRAIIHYSFSKYFPKNLYEENRIVNEPIEGKVPRVIASSMIHCVREALNLNETIKIEEECRKLIEECQNPDDFSINWEDFCDNESLKNKVNHAFSTLSETFAKKSDEERMEWINKILENNNVFKNMNRSLTDEEYDIIKKELFR